MEPENIYRARIGHFQQEMAGARKWATTLVWGRLLCFLLTLAFFVLYVRNGMATPWLAGSALGVAGFLWCIARHQQAVDQLLLLKTLLNINEKELEQVTTYRSGFEDGNQYVDDRHDFTGDLDVFGPASIYQYINRTGTLSGSERLAAVLRAPMQEPERILAVQDALRELSPKVEFRQQLTAHAMLTGEKPEDKAAIQSWLDLPFDFINRPLLRIFCWASPILVILAVIVLINTRNVYPLVGILIINWGLLLTQQKKILARHQLMSNKEKILHKFSLALQLLQEETFTSSVLLQEQQQAAVAADAALRRLSRISNALDQRLNLLVGLVLNSVVLYDFHCMFRLELWKKHYRNRVMEWMDIVAKMEVWDSFATFAFNHPAYAWPVPQETPLFLEAAAMGHPLIPEQECVRNDGSIGRDAQFLIITGSNMSGKSTWLRSTGANLLLAMCGAPVCAKSFTFSPVRMMTSMRIKDSIASHTSYFQAELLRLQHIIRVLKTGERVFILLDEILKGTNSEDKLSGSRSLIEHFLQYQCLGLIATHDLELGQLQGIYPDKVRNYCFESTIRGNELFFDYRMREGIARNKNATFLMKQMEII